MTIQVGLSPVPPGQAAGYRRRPRLRIMKGGNRQAEGEGTERAYGEQELELDA
ncbi:hypothetical protein [Streptomyces sp. ODS28]|uniref:hypothetical protein n=1 Tax=Streptomyces sp. ODS28 TaxID=3136688 RepID=UPI0031EE72E0